MYGGHGVTTIFDRLEKPRGAAFAREGVERLMSVFNVAPVNDEVVDGRLRSRGLISRPQSGWGVPDWSAFELRNV